jgi:hypothetical protein
LTFAGLALVVLLVYVVVGFIQGLETSLAVSGDSRVVIVNSLGTSENLENSSVPGRTAALLSDSLGGIQRRYDAAYVSPEQYLGTRVGDVAFALVICGFRTLAAGDCRWGMFGRWHIYVTAALLGAGCAIGYEWRARALWRWSYTDRMPIVPLLGVGLWPFPQLMLLVPVAFAVADWAARRG